MALDPKPPSRALDPMTGNPVCPLVRHRNVVTRDPDVFDSVPAPMAWIPVVTGSGRSWILNDYLWGRHPDIDIGAEASRCQSNQSDARSKCRSSPPAPKS